MTVKTDKPTDYRVKGWEVFFGERFYHDGFECDVFPIRLYRAGNSHYAVVDATLVEKGSHAFHIDHHIIPMIESLAD